MAIEIMDIMYVIVTIGLIFVLKLFYNAMEKLKVKLIFLYLWIVSTILTWVVILLLIDRDHEMMNKIRWSFLCGGIICYYYFIERAEKMSPSRFNIIMVTILSVLLFYSMIFQTRVYSLSYFHAVAIYVYSFGAKFFYKGFKKTKEKMALYLLFASIIKVVHFIIQTFVWLIFTEADSDLRFIIGTLADGLLLIALIIYIWFFVKRGDYFLRFTSDQYILMVSYPSGIPIFKVDFINSKDVKVAENLISGFLSAINSMFKESLSTNNVIEAISNEDTTILMEAGNMTIGTIIGEKPNKLLANSLRKFLLAFEKEFDIYLEHTSTKLENYEFADVLIPEYFPYLRIDKTQEDF